MKQKIKVQKEWPFYYKYHDDRYISRHDCSKKVSLREFKESARAYIFLNNSQKEIVVYKIDGGVIDNKDISKCDYGIYTEDGCLFLIELKGSDLEHAIKQINSTIKILLKQPHVKVKRLNVRIVLSRVSVPRIVASEEKKLKQLLHKTYGGGNYKKQSRTLEDTY